MTNPSASRSRITGKAWVKLAVASAIAATWAAAVMLALRHMGRAWEWRWAEVSDASSYEILIIASIIGAIVLCTRAAQRGATICADAPRANSELPVQPKSEGAQAAYAAKAPSSEPELDQEYPSAHADDSANSQHCHETPGRLPSVASPYGFPDNPHIWLPADRRILLVESNFNDRRSIAVMIDRCGIDVEIAADAEEAIEMLLAANEYGDPFDLALIDAYLPRSDGFTVCQAIRAAGILAEAMPIVTLLPGALIGGAASRICPHRQAYLFKPVMMEDLVRTLNRWLPHRIVEDRPPSEHDPLDDLDLDGLEDELQRWMIRRGDAVSTIERAIAHHAFEGRSRRLLAKALRQVARTASLYGEEELGRHAAMLERALHDGDTAHDCRKLAEAFLAAAQHTPEA